MAEETRQPLTASHHDALGVARSAGEQEIREGEMAMRKLYDHRAHLGDAAATDALRRLNEASNSVDEGIVLRTDPEAGTTVSPDQQITVYVSSGVIAVPVPDVARMAEADAIAAIEAKKLVYGVTTQDYSPDLASGVVIRSDPEGGATTVNGETIREGATVNLVVSNGLVSIPDVTGKTVAAANTELSALQLRITSTTVAGCPVGQVASQSRLGEQPQKSEVSLGICVG